MKKKTRIALLLDEQVLDRRIEIFKTMQHWEKEIDSVYFVHKTVQDSRADNTNHEIKKNLILDVKTPFVALSGYNTYKDVVDKIYEKNQRHRLNFPIIGLNYHSIRDVPIFPIDDDFQTGVEKLISQFIHRYLSFQRMFAFSKQIEENALIEFDQYIALSSLDDVEVLKNINFDTLEQNTDANVIYTRSLETSFGLVCANWSMLYFKKGDRVDALFDDGPMKMLDYFSIIEGYINSIMTVPHRREDRLFPLFCAYNLIDIKQAPV